MRARHGSIGFGYPDPFYLDSALQGTGAEGYLLAAFRDRVASVLLQASFTQQSLDLVAVPKLDSSGIDQHKSLILMVS
jgi:hypothetical protein